MAWTGDLQQTVRELARSVGFDRAEVASLDESPGQADALDADRFSSWIEAGHAGEMEYLKRRDEQGTLLRSSVRTAMPWARSVLVCAMNYNASAPRSIDNAPVDSGWIARYAWSGREEPQESPAGVPGRTLQPTDYHDELLSRLREVEARIHEHAACETRCYVDTGPLVERNIAARAGIGWIGKNTCVINQQLGSWLLLGVIVTSLPVAADALSIPAQDRCGSCTRCIDACPTDALLAPRQMDASRCIAYLTIEKKGTIPEELREPMGRQVFGCDICQDVCPWNRRAPVSVKQGMASRPELVNPSLAWLASLDAPGFRQQFKGSPLERTRRKRLHRNVAVAMGNSGDPSCLPQLEQWSQGEDDVLAETARWAVQKIRSSISPS
ncbi:MAG: tRNA epoxyqueuosine(34) reductase QueG [Edaphobacter sp.]|uniref:tRNA epoxyqueuosine(34) reductase QueG n=1 Tax=Edaphobacter sp. TaxID=1934404 RepID=UPI00239BB90A|nr:tRNA epoxyqueuosine(34) reductase QueG [Edaphobacter sp.]MDE1177352.1 tRNA epoxyqueuosine(34) reductase QueG [Edaphobacter sp.]